MIYRSIKISILLLQSRRGSVRRDRGIEGVPSEDEDPEAIGSEVISGSVNIKNWDRI